MTISEAWAKIGVQATFTPVNDELEGRAMRVGDRSLGKSWSDADVAYGFSVTGAGVADVVELTLSTGAAVLANGTPTISRAGGSGEDAEGETLPTMATIYALRVKSTGVGHMTVGGTMAGLPALDLNASDDVVFTSTSGMTVAAEIVQLTTELATSECEVIVIGKS